MEGGGDFDEQGFFRALADGGIRYINFLDSLKRATR
jgi:hypothetical protein